MNKLETTKNILNKAKKLKKNKKTVAYISIKKDKIDIVKQKQILEGIIQNYAKTHDLIISKYYIDYIPSRLEFRNRHSLKKLLKEVKNKEIGQVLIPDIHHISRSSPILHRVIENFVKYEVKIVCCRSRHILG